VEIELAGDDGATAVGAKGFSVLTWRRRSFGRRAVACGAAATEIGCAAELWRRRAEAAERAELRCAGVAKTGVRRFAAGNAAKTYCVAAKWGGEREGCRRRWRRRRRALAVSSRSPCDGEGNGGREEGWRGRAGDL
jgi:hypothetical protein